MLPTNSTPLYLSGDGNRLMRWGALWVFLSAVMYLSTFFTLPFNPLPFYGLGPIVALGMDFYAHKKEKAKGERKKSVARWAIDSAWRVIGISFVMLVVLLFLFYLSDIIPTPLAFFVIGMLLPSFAVATIGFMLNVKMMILGGVAGILFALLLLLELLSEGAVLRPVHHLYLLLSCYYALVLPGKKLNKIAKGR